MTTLTLPSAASSARTAGAPNGRRALGALLLIEGLLAFAPVAILGPAIGWPASLRNPPAEQMAAIAAQPDALALGYGVYLLYSLLIAPVMIGLAARLGGARGLADPVAATVAAFGALSALARSIGILRWLTVMPALAGAHAAADPAGRGAVEALFGAINSYGGGIGELLGVGVLMAGSLGTLAVAGWRRRVLPVWLAASGLLSALLLAGMLAPALRLPLHVPVAAAASALSLWMLAAGVWCWRSGRGGAADA